MSFEEAYRVEQRVRMLADHDARSWSVVGLCTLYSVSRHTFYE